MIRLRRSNYADEKGKAETGGGMTLEGGGCGGEWRYPRHCSPVNHTCDYQIKWLYKSRKVHFVLVNCIFQKLFPFFMYNCLETILNNKQKSTKQTFYFFFFAGYDFFYDKNQAHELVDRSWIF